MDNGNIVNATIRTTAKKEKIVVGDYVELQKNDYDKDKFIITKVLPRKNYIPRPFVANIDKLLIVIACKPEPDLLLVDKLIIYCMINDIEPIIVINKVDIASKDFIEDIKKQYYFIDVYEISAKQNYGIDMLKEQIVGNLCVVCGQSAVGKSSFLNALIPTLSQDTQELSFKINRGKHTTRVNEVFIDNNLMIADTPGFSSLELELDYKELALYYPEFEEYLGKCKYLDCSHIKEGKDCVVVSALNENKINKSRYDRFVDLYNNLKEKWEKKYD